MARLKEKGRQEYHQHRTIHFPWGSRTLLEQKDGYTVFRLLIYPSSTLQVEVAAAVAMHLVVVKGPARIDANGKTQRLNQGKALTVSSPGVVSIENKSQEPIYLIQIQLGA